MAADHWPPCSEPGVGTYAPQDRTSADALDALRELSTGDQRLLLLVAREHFDRDQLAALFGVSPATISAWLYHARVRFAHALAARKIGSRDRRSITVDVDAAPQGLQ
jgi:DNA-directed RNA polymerase specialized sigma24 family protein